MGKRTFSFQATPALPPIDVYSYVPRSRNEASSVVIALHGNGRDAEDTRDNWVAKAEQYGCLVFAPEFSEADFPGGSGYILGNVFENGNDPAGSAPLPEDQWAFSVIEPLFDEIQERVGQTFDRYELFGHSAGGQFAHRFVLFFPGGRYHRVVAANPGWYTVPDIEVDFPYGLAGSPIETAAPSYFGRALIVFYGELDTDPNSPGLRHNAQADAQGLHRAERAEYFHQRSQELAEAQNLDFAWSLRSTPGVGHDGFLMSQRAADLLFGD
jgi:pimeloyl-ACP methyl ester carboxylesterase